MPAPNEPPGAKSTAPTPRKKSRSRKPLLQRMIAALAPIHPGEGITALWLAINVFVLMTCYYILKVVREPLILLGGGAELKVYASAGQTVLLLGVVPAFGWLASRVPRLRLLTIVNLILAGCLVVFCVLARIEAPIGLAFYLWLGIFSVLIVSNFWSFATDLYTQEQGKRLFAPIGLGGSIGAILGAWLPGPLLEVLGTYLLMLVGAGGLVLSTVIYRIIDHRERHDRDPRGLVSVIKAEAVQPVGREGGFRLVLRDRYLTLVAFSLLMSTLVNTIGEYVVGKMVKDASATSANPDLFIASFYSGYYGLVNTASALLQGFAVSRVLSRVGIRKTLFVMPLVVLVGWIAFAMKTTLGTIRITKITENSVDYSIHKTVGQALYLPTSREGKYKAKVAIDTFFFRMGDVVAAFGIVFVFINVLGLGLHALVGVNVVLALVWLALSWRTGRLHDIRAEERRARAQLGLRETAP